MPKVTQDVTGRLAASYDAALAQGLDTRLSMEAAQRQLLADQKDEQIRRQRDVRTGALPSTPGTLGTAERVQMDNVIERAGRSARERLASMFQTVNVISDSVTTIAKDAIAAAQRSAVEQTRVLDEYAASVTQQTRDEVTAAERSKAQAAQAADRSQATSPVSQPRSGERRTDDRNDSPDPQRPAEDSRPGDPRLSRPSTRLAAAGRARVSGVQARVEQQDTMAARVGSLIHDRGVALQESKPFGYDAEGNVRHMGEDGSLGEVATDQEARSFGRAMNSARVLRNYGGSIAQSDTIRQGIGKALPGGLVKAAGIAGAVYVGANKAADIAQEQRQQNMAFRSVQGETEGMGLFDTGSLQQRGEMRRFRLSQGFQRGFGGMDAASADALYMGATEQGLQGSARRQALDLGAENFRKYGMEVQDSLRLITVATKEGSSGLYGIAEALEGVTEAAARSGVNAKVARDNFIAAYEQAAPMFAGAGTAAAVAGGQAAATAGLGSEFAGVNLGGNVNEGQMRRIAASSGRSYADLVLNSQGPQGGVEFLQQSQALTNRMLATQFGPEAEQMILGAVQENGNQALNANQLTDLAQRATQATPSLDPGTVSRLLESYGVTGVSPDNAIQTAIAMLSGTADPAREAESQRKAMLNRSAGSLNDVVTPTSTGELGVTKSAERQRIEDEIGGGGRGLDFDFNFDGSERQLGGARSKYLDLVGKTGKASPIIEKMLKEGDTNQRFVVKASNGKKGKDAGTYERVVNMEEGLRVFGDQFLRGDVKIEDGTGKGKTLAEQYGGEVDEGIEITSDDKVTDDTRSAGRSRRNYDRDKDKDGDKGGGEVLITPSPELARLLRFEGTGGVRVGATTPLSPHVPGVHLPTGNPGSR